MVVLVLAFLVACVAAGPLVNGNFDAANTVDPWLVNPFNGGSSTCSNVPSPNPLQCELTQQQAISGLSNSGRISVGRPTCGSCSGTGSQGQNVYQKDITVCPGNTISAFIGVQDSRTNTAIARFSTTFSLLVGDDSYELLGGPAAVVASHTFPAPSAPFNNLQSLNLVGIWTAPAWVTGPANYAVGVRVERNDSVRQQVRAFIDNVVVADHVLPIISASDVQVRASACDGTAEVTLPATATDNCGGSPTLSYSFTGASGLVTFSGPTYVFSVGTYLVTVTATDASANVATATFTVVVNNPLPTISCIDVHYDTQQCWSSVAQQTGIEAATTCGEKIPFYEFSGETSTSLSSFLFPVGNNWVTATILSDNGNNGQDASSCSFDVVPNLCCAAEPPSGRRAVSASPTLISTVKKQ